jgi:glucoamylase
VKLLLLRCGEEEARLSDGEAETAVLPDELRGLYQEAVAQLLELVPDYDALFGLDPTAPTGDGGVERWGPELDRAGWSGPLLRFKLAVLRRAGRRPVMRWAHRFRRAIPRRLLKAFLAALNAALGSLGAIPGVDLLREIKEFLEGASGDEGNAGATEDDDGNGSDGEPEGTASTRWQKQQGDGGTLQYSLIRPAVTLSDLTAIAQYMFWLMFRNVASDGLVFEDPVRAGILSQPGCVLASPSWENSRAPVTQDYVYNWTRDAAIVAAELAAWPLATNQPLTDYVQFAQTCQDSAAGMGHFDRASFLIDGTARAWTDQTDGPALQTLAILQLFAQLDPPTQAVATAVIAANLSFLETAYADGTTNLWEEVYGASFFARSLQLKCFQAVSANTLGIPVPSWLNTAMAWLENSLGSHWTGQYYQSVIPAPLTKVPYDPNIDIIMAAIYGAIPVTDTKLLATAALLRSQWADPTSQYFYPINGADQERGIGPMLGRYPGDTYDGDTDAQAGDHPWAVSTANFAELYYRLAAQVTTTGMVPLDDLSASFFSQIGVDSSATPPAAATALRNAGDRMLQAIVFHSDHLELSEQFDATTGYEKSVSNLSWSYASFLSAIRARNAS